MLLKIATATLLGAASLPLTVAQFSTSSSFQAPPLVVGDLAVWCIFAFLFLIQTVICLCSLIVASGHRTAFAILLLVTILTVILCFVSIAWTIVINMTFVNMPDQVFPPLATISALFSTWTSALLYLAITCVHWDRRVAINAASEKRTGPLQVVVSIIRAILFVFVFAAGTTYGALVLKFYQALYPSPSNSDFPIQTDPAVQTDLATRFHAEQRANYVFVAFCSVTAIDVMVSSTLLYTSIRKAGVNDKMTKVLLFGVSPLYVLLIITQIVFVILFSPAGRSVLTTRNAFYSAFLASDILSNVFSYSIPMILIVMGLRRSNWIVEGGKMHHGAHQGWTQQQVYGPPQPSYSLGPQPQYYQQQHAPQQEYVPQQSPQQDTPGVVLEREQGQEEKQNQG